MRFSLGRLVCVLAILSCVFISVVAKASNLITGAGSSFIAPVLYKWASQYKNETGVKINYQSTGSGAGIKQIQGKIVDFGATDMPLNSEDLETKGLTQFPAVIGGIVIITNIQGVSQGQLILNAQTLAEIYSGQIKNWNDKRIAELNPHVTLPNKGIIVVYRSDASGTTYNFTYFLEKSAPSIWKSGSGTAISWSSSIMGVGGKGNEGVTNMVKRAPGAIGYVEYAYALQNKMAWTRMFNAEGKLVPHLTESEFADDKKVSQAFRHSFQAAALNAEWEKTSGMGVLLANQNGAASWPITAATFILIAKQQENASIGKDVLKFFHYAFTKGAETAESLDYIPIPEKTVKLIEKNWSKEIKSLKDKSSLWDL